VANGRRRRRFLAWGRWKEKEKVLGLGPMEGEGKGSWLEANGRRRRRFFAWWPMEGEGEGFLLGGQWKEKEKVLCYLFPFFPQATLLKPSFFIL
jgi:hypothetical protein